MPLSVEPLERVRDNVIRVLYSPGSDSSNLISGSTSLNGVRLSHPWLVLETGEPLQYYDVLSDGVGV